MQITRRETGGSFRRMAALWLALALLAPAAVMTAGAEPEYVIEDITGEMQEVLARAALDKRTRQDEKLKNIRIRRNGQIHGRGKSDEPSGAEPDYTGLVGYAAVADSADLKPGPEYMAVPWSNPGYQLFSNHWYYSRTVQHKTSVLVIDQHLKAVGDGQYTGRLKVIRLDSNEICWIDVENFITVPYWFYPLKRANLYGSVLASYQNCGGRLPTDPDGNPVEVADNTNVLVPGAGVWDQRAPEGSRMIAGMICRTETRTPEDKTAPETAGTAETKETETGVTTREIPETYSVILYFPEEDLRIIY